MPLFLGIDAGTGSVRASVVDGGGHILGSASAPYNTYFPANGWAEQDCGEWESALQKAVPESLRAAGIRAETLSGITCDATTNTLVFLDAWDKPVRRPFLWMDVRAAEEASYLDTFRGKYEALDVYKPSFRADTMIPKTMWFKFHEPANWEKTATVFELEDWLNWRLTGEKTLSIPIASYRWNYGMETDGLPVKLYEAAGISDVMEKIPKARLHLGAFIGEVTEEAAKRYGLSEGIPVYEGPADCNAGMFGAGCVRPGLLALIGGTSSVIHGMTAESFHESGVNGVYPDCMIPGLGLAEGGQTSSGAVLTWFRNTLFPAEWVEECKARSIDAYELITLKAAAAPIGSGGVVLLSDFQGNRAPYADSRARGVFAGLSLATDASHLARAIFEGVAFGACHCVQAMQVAGLKFDRILACGGICNSSFWLQLHADIIGLPIVTAEETQNCSAIGDAMIAAVGAGFYADYEEAARSMVRTGRVYEPDSAIHEQYRFFMERYKELWPAVRPTVHALVRHENE